MAFCSYRLIAMCLGVTLGVDRRGYSGIRR